MHDLQEAPLEAGLGYGNEADAATEKGGRYSMTDNSHAAYEIPFASPSVSATHQVRGGARPSSAAATNFSRPCRRLSNTAAFLHKNRANKKLKKPTNNEDIDYYSSDSNTPLNPAPYESTAQHNPNNGLRLNRSRRNI